MHHSIDICRRTLKHLGRAKLFSIHQGVTQSKHSDKIYSLTEIISYLRHKLLSHHPKASEKGRDDDTVFNRWPMFPYSSIISFTLKMQCTNHTVMGPACFKFTSGSKCDSINCLKTLVNHITSINHSKTLFPYIMKNSEKVTFINFCHFLTV